MGALVVEFEDTNVEGGRNVRIIRARGAGTETADKNHEPVSRSALSVMVLLSTFHTQCTFVGSPPVPRDYCPSVRIREWQNEREREREGRYIGGKVSGTGAGASSSARLSKEILSL